MSRDILHRKAGAGGAIGKGRWSGGRPFEKSIRSPFGRVTSQEGIFEHNSGRPLLHAFFDEALCMNIGIPRVVGVGVEGITGRWRVRGISLAQLFLKAYSFP